MRYFMIGIVTAFYSIMSQVPSQGFQGSAKNAHELRMGNLLGQIRWQGLLVFFMVFVLVTYVFMHDPAYVATAGKIEHSLAQVGVNPDPQSAQHIQMLVPAALPYMLPAGMIGLFCAIMFAALISSSTGFLHAWGSVLLQDIILPFRKKPMETSHHILALRLSIVAVALIAFTLSLMLNPQDSILMFLARFNAIWLGPAGAVILGGLYWKRGTARKRNSDFCSRLHTKSCIHYLCGPVVAMDRQQISAERSVDLSDLHRFEHCGFCNGVTGQ